MSRRNDSPVLALIVTGVILLVAVGFAIFWIATALTMGAPVVFPLFGLGFLAVLGMVVFAAIKQARKVFQERRQNEAAPVVTSRARVVTRRQAQRQTKSNTFYTYYAAFELESGGRREFELSGEEYGRVVEGDVGVLTHQGTWFQNFAPEPRPPNSAAPAAMTACDYCGAGIPAGAVKCPGCGSAYRPRAAGIR